MLAKYQKFAPLIIRLGLAIVFFLFGLHKLSVPTQTTAEIQLLYNLSIGSASAINFYVGLLEITIALLLVTGWKLQLAALAASAMTFFIFISLVIKSGALQSSNPFKIIDPNLYRDLGLSAAGLALFLLAGGQDKNQDQQQ